jgi:PAS domain S-box-containing protein
LLSVHAYPFQPGVAAVWRDITAARSAERRLALSQARYHEVADGLPAAAWLSRADGKLEFINQAMVSALGRPRRALLGDGWLDSMDPDERKLLLVARADARARHSSFHYEGHFRRPDGALRVIELYGAPRFDEVGGFRGHVGIATDVTESREAEARQRVLANELNHRVKNTLAIVQSLVRHTLRDHKTPDAVEHDLTERLLALSAAHDVLSREQWHDVELADVIVEVMRPYSQHLRNSLEGPGARVDPKTAIALAMGLHELATNAAKYGALSTPTGQIELSGLRLDDQIALQWRERGGPPVTSPTLTGFGSVLLGRILANQFGVPAQLSYPPEGLVCRMNVPVMHAHAA